MDRRARRALGGRLQTGHRRLATCREPLGASRGLLLSAPHRFDGAAPPGSLARSGPNAASWWASLNRPTACAGWLTSQPSFSDTIIR